jgi:hypothetical protein
VDKLTGKDWLLFLLIQSCKSNELRKKIPNLPDNKITLENVLALARKYESTEVACKEKDTINNIFMQKEKKGGKSTPSQPVHQPNVTQSSANANGKRNKTGAKRPCNRCGEDSTYEHRQNCPAKADTCTNCKKKGHRAVICHNGKRFNANGQVASASATPESGATTDFANSKRLDSTRGSSRTSSRGISNNSSSSQRNACKSEKTSESGNLLKAATRLCRPSATSMTSAGCRHRCSST